jgi:hypothetical protein
MMSAATIAALAAEQAERAYNEGVEPLVTTKEGAKKWVENFQCPVPNIGSYVPDGWTEVDSVFVDKGGRSDTGPATGMSGLVDFVHEQQAEYGEDNVGFAISEEGEFQLYVSAYVRK